MHDAHRRNRSALRGADSRRAAPADSDGRRGLLLVVALLTAVGPLAIACASRGSPRCIQTFLTKAASILPYMGAGTAVRHVLGNDSGGGYEWAATHGPVPRGITALALDAWGRIERLPPYDGAYADTAMFTALAQYAIER